MVLGGKTVLVIDDDLDFQVMMGSMLERWGFGVKYLIEGRLTSVLDSAKHCDVILLDVELPGLNGLEIAKELKSKAETAAIPIILITGHDDSEQLFFASNADMLVKKPFSLSTLHKKISELISRSIPSFSNL